MKHTTQHWGWLAISALLLASLGAHATNSTAPTQAVQTTAERATVSLDIYKSPRCGCCVKWAEHVEASGFDTHLHHPNNLAGFKANLGITPPHQSCHTAVSPNGFVFEGHIPADIIQRFLANPPPQALGLAVPGMPVGSPGMEMGHRHDNYDVLLLNKDGSHSVYERIRGKRQQQGKNK